MREPLAVEERLVVRDCRSQQLRLCAVVVDERAQRNLLVPRDVLSLRPVELVVPVAQRRRQVLKKALEQLDEMRSESRIDMMRPAAPHGMMSMREGDRERGRDYGPVIPCGTIEKKRERTRQGSLACGA